MACLRCIIMLAVVSLFISRSTAGEPRTLLLLGQKPDGHPPGTHEYMAGQRVLAKCLAGVRDLQCMVVQADDPWPGGPKLLEKADGVVLFVSEGAKWIHANAARRDSFEQLAARGGALTVLHWGMGTREAEPIANFLKLFGGCHGGADRKYKVLENAEVLIADTEDPIVQGIRAFRVKDEFYYRLKFATSPLPIRPVLQVPIDGENQTVAWRWERPDGGRSFGFSGLHFHENWGRPEYPQLIAQAVLWTMKIPVPKDGLTIRLAPEDVRLQLAH